MQAVSSIIRKVVVCTALAGFATVSLPLATAQQNNATRGGIGGIVTDPTGAAVSGAKVTIAGSQQTIDLTTGANGRYEASGLVPGTYTVTISAPSFSKYVSSGNQVTIDHTVTLDATLSLGNVDTTVSVEAGATAIDTENTSVNAAITDVFYEQMPLPRNVAGAFYTAPGVVSGGGTGNSNPSIGGSSGLENLYVADGVTITDQAYGGLGVYTASYGSLGSGITLSFVKEVDIKTAAFEPRYGQADGGIVEIVTKSGGNQYHGKIAAYVGPQNAYASAKQLYQYNYVVTTPTQVLAEPSYELDAEFGGYIPGFREKLFFFGSFDPTLSRRVLLANPNVPLFSKGTYNYNTTATNWAGKLTFNPSSTTIVEASSFGDPSRRNVRPNSLSATNATLVSSSYNYGTRDSVIRINSALLPWLTASGSYSYSTEHFTENPLVQNYAISDRTSTPFVPYGFGTYYKTKDANWVLQGDLQANANFLGKHTASIGYLFDHVNFNNSTLRSGPGFAIPGANADGAKLTSLYSNVPASAIGKTTNATFYMRSAGGLTSGCTYCAIYKGKEVYLQQIRGTYNGSVVAAIDRYKAAYGNEVWSPERHVTINAGLRWEQQTYGGALLTYVWHDNWSPRLGITLDPMGDRKSKVFFNYSRYQNPLPLDAAIRQLGSEQDDTTFFYAPKVDASGNAVLDTYGEVIPNTSVALNGTQKNASGTVFGAPNFGSSTGEGILPGTKMEYTNEYVLGAQRELKPGMVLSVRYMDRQLGRVVEDNGSNSPEGAYVDANFAGGIANISANSDFFVNEKEVTYTQAQFAAANAGRDPGQATRANYVAPAPGCTYDNDTSVANGGFFTHYDGTPYPGACVTNALTDGGNNGSDGKPDGFADPRRHYQALEVELNRNLRNHWQARINYRYAKLWGNYEGFFRNDNGQSDPGISSLFDFTQGAIGLLGDQFKRGYLNTDRRHVANALISYQFDKSNRFLGRIGDGLTVGAWLHALTGTPLSAYQSHPVYLNAGEVPIGGRGTYGRLPTQAYLDVNVGDKFRINDKFHINAAFDGFNVTDNQVLTGQNQNLDTSYGSPANADYGKPNSFLTPFRARFSVALEF